MKMPHLRLGLASHAAWLEGLFEAYGVTVLALEKFRRASELNPDLIREYESLCDEIEHDVEDGIESSKTASS
jgi:hypothetical protein